MSQSPTYKAKTEITNIERTITDKSGNERFLLINAKSVNVQGGTVLYVMRDITERKRAEEALQQLNETLEQQVMVNRATGRNRISFCIGLRLPSFKSRAGRSGMT